MRFTVFLGFLLSLVLAVMATQTDAPLRSIIVSFPGDTPSSVLQKAKEAIIAAGGEITHEYNIIKGFAATAPETVYDTIKTLGDKYIPNIEEDQMVSIQKARKPKGSRS